MTTPLPAANPSALITNGAANWSRKALAGPASSNTPKAAVGNPWRTAKALVKALEDSSWPAAAGAETGDARGGQGVGEAGLDGGFRPDHDQVGGDLARQGQ